VELLLKSGSNVVCIPCGLKEMIYFIVNKAFTIMDHCHPTSVCVGSSLWLGQYGYVRKLAGIFSWVGGSFWVLPGSSSTINTGRHV